VSQVRGLKQGGYENLLGFAFNEVVLADDCHCHGKLARVIKNGGGIGAYARHGGRLDGGPSLLADGFDLLAR
jgi:hypothetical protein